jgi:hypothetical protein
MSNTIILSKAHSRIQTLKIPRNQRLLGFRTTSWLSIDKEKKKKKKKTKHYDDRTTLVP